ncbi:MAG: four helix bundle protein [Candidatus Magasanikbacteria bacterium]|nr:four helix bundle protein [Candidatus Magasanikbacteria bacterium]
MNFNDSLKLKMHLYVKAVYKCSKLFPGDELYGITSQLRRSSMSVVLNFIEGFARRKGPECADFKNFVRLSYGSLKESEYIIYFCLTENYINRDAYDELSKQANEIGAMLYGILEKTKLQK